MTLLTVKSLKISSLSNEIIIKLLNNWGLEFCSDFSLIIDLFSLYVLFSHCRPRGGVPENSVSVKHRQIHVHPREYVCIIHEKTEGTLPWEHHVA